MPLLAVMALAVMVGEIVTVKMAPNRGDVAPSNTFAFALLILGGPAIAILAMFVACTIADLRDGKSPVKDGVQLLAVHDRAVPQLAGAHDVHDDLAPGALRRSPTFRARARRGGVLRLQHRARSRS